jgi:parvulin-like peptidyl-prolyl isomerase
LRAAAGAPDGATRTRAEEVTRRLRAGEDFASVRAALGDLELAPLPDAPLPIEKLRDYLGPSAVSTLLGLMPGQVSDPIRSTSGYVVLVLVEQSDAEIPPLAEVEPQVRAALRNRSGDDALRRYLDDLRKAGAVELAETSP